MCPPEPTPISGTIQFITSRLTSNFLNRSSNFLAPSAGREYSSVKLYIPGLIFVGTLPNARLIKLKVFLRKGSGPSVNKVLKAFFIIAINFEFIILNFD